MSLKRKEWTDKLCLSQRHPVLLDANVSRDVSIANRAGIGLVIEPTAQRYRIDTVLLESPAARAGIRSGDVLVRINHVEPRTRAQVEQALKGAPATPLLLEIERDVRRIAFVIPETALR